jgi:hypothetical protein
MKKPEFSHFRHLRETDETLNDAMHHTNFNKFGKQFEPDHAAEKRDSEYQDFFDGFKARRAIVISEPPELRESGQSCLTGCITG